jgi:hypothetical protein
VQLDEDMTVEQINMFVQKLKEENKKIVRVKVVGGEPTIHPQLQEVCDILSKAHVHGWIGKIDVNTNGTTLDTLRMPAMPGIFFKVSRPSRKAHRPFLWNPKDIGLDTFGPCAMPRRCGFSLDARGWLPCSAAPAIVRVYGLENLYRPLDGPLPPELWGLDDLCPNCIHSVNDKSLRSKKFVDAPENWKESTISWKEKLAEWMKNNPDKVLM